MKLRSLLAVSGAVCALGTVANAATTLDITNVAMNNPATVTLSGPGINEEVYDSALLFTTSKGATFPVFCVDIWHQISLGAANITYKEGSLTTNSSGALSGTGAALSSTQIGEIEGLADLGTGLVRLGGANLAVNLAGVQGAIWSIENPAVTVSGDTAVMSRIAYYESYAATHQADNAIALYDVKGVAQGQIMGVPEPATWSLMLLGFGGLGAAMRQSRRGQAKVLLAAL